MTNTTNTNTTTTNNTIQFQLECRVLETTTDNNLSWPADPQEPGVVFSGRHLSIYSFGSGWFEVVYSNGSVYATGRTAYPYRKNDLYRTDKRAWLEGLLRTPMF